MVQTATSTTESTNGSRLFETRKIAIPYFVAAVILFLLQIVFGLIGAFQHVYPLWLRDTNFAFGVIRQIHVNLAIFWLLLGIMGATFYILAEDTGTELYSPRLAWIQFWLLVAAGVATVISSILGYSEGREYLEAPRPIDWIIVVAALLFTYNIFQTIRRKTRKEWRPTLTLLVAGLAGLTAVYLAGMIFFPNLVLDEYFRWWVVHLWVEGTWELIAGAIVGFFLIGMTGIDRSKVARLLYFEAALVLLTGILGTGHHYYWIGVPAFWLWVGGFFSALEPVPLSLMVWDTRKMLFERTREEANRVALLFIVGSVVLNLIGAGMMGFAITLPQVNRFTHGTFLTPAHGHPALFGTYGLLILGVIYYALPEMKGIKRFNQGPGVTSFWLLVIGLAVITGALTVAGVIQSYLQPVMGLSFRDVRPLLLPYKIAWAIGGIIFALGALVLALDLWRLVRRPAVAGHPLESLQDNGKKAQADPEEALIRGRR